MPNADNATAALAPPDWQPLSRTNRPIPGEPLLVIWKGEGFYCECYLSDDPDDEGLLIEASGTGTWNLDRDEELPDCFVQLSHPPAAAALRRRGTRPGIAIGGSSLSPQQERAVRQALGDFAVTLTSRVGPGDGDEFRELQQPLLDVITMLVPAQDAAPPTPVMVLPLDVSHARGH